MKKKIADNYINTKILKLQKEDEERKAFEELYNEHEEDHDDSDIDDETDWSWYKPDDNDIYFIVTTAYP